MSEATLRYGAVATDLSLGLDEVKQNLQVLHNADDITIGALIQAAVVHLENAFSLCIYRSTVRAHFDCFGARMTLKRATNCSLAEIKYMDGAGNDQTFDIDKTRLSQDMPNYEYLTLRPGKSWPDDVELSADIIIEYEAGWAKLNDDLPACIAQAIKLLVGHWYKEQANSTKKRLHNIPMGVDALMARFVTI